MTIRHDLLIDPARYPQMPLTFEPNDQQRRCLTVLCAWQAPHNMRHYTTKAGIEPSGSDGITLAVRQPWSTYDMDELTRLVAAAHQWRVRVQLSGRARNILGVHMHARQPDGDLYERHPGPSRFDSLADLVGPMTTMSEGSHDRCTRYEGDFDCLDANGTTACPRCFALHQQVQP